jgi:hypothetical protein
MGTKIEQADGRGFVWAQVDIGNAERKIEA